MNRSIFGSLFIPGIFPHFVRGEQESAGEAANE
jgi:hypothetical protein